MENLRSYDNGDKIWVKNGARHRVDGPAIELGNGEKQWWVNGKKHRVNGPAMIGSNGDKEWWVNGEQHRLDGPATEYVSGYKAWWIKGKRHRLDGPAIEWSNGQKSWYVNDSLLSFEQFCIIHKFISRLRVILSCTRALGMSPGKFMRLNKLIKTQAFIEWFYSPDQPGGRLSKKKLEKIIQ